jgi:hypothetical protein
MTTSSMPIEGYARMRAEMDAGRLRDDVLARAGVSVDDWTVVQRSFLEQMGAELERGRFGLTNRYTQAFVERQRELLSAAPPPAEPKEAAPPPFEVEPTLDVPPPAPLQPSFRSEASAPKPLPSFQLEDPLTEAPDTSPVAPPAARENLGSTSFAWQMPAGLGALPFQAAPAAPPPPEHAPAARSGLPFQVAPAAPPPPEHAPARSGLPFQVAPAGLSALPFQSAPAPVAPVAPPASAAPPAPTGKANLGATSTHDVNAFRAALPFMVKQQQAAAEAAAQSAVAAPNLPAAAPPPRPAAPPAADTPFRQPAAQEAEPAPSAPALTLEQYAALCAELAALPQQSSVIFQRYGLASTSDRLRTDLAWQERLRRNPAEYQEWQGLYGRYYAYWVEQARRTPGR